MSNALIPESAPFSEEQRAWLNGFFAGMMGIGESRQDLPLNANAVPASGPALAEPEDFPWHDSALELDERLKLAEDQPVERKLMAAMAQLDCGACGYLCKTYGEAIASGQEKNLSLCVPGGKQTSKTLKKIVKQSGTPEIAGPTQSDQSSKELSWSRAKPYSAKLLACESLNGSESDKDTRHIEIGLGDSGLHYEVGDALGVYPTNCDELVGRLVSALDADADHGVTTAAGPTSLATALRDECCLRDPTDELLELLVETADDGEKRQLLALLEDDTELDGCDVLDVLERFSSARPQPEQLVAALGSLNPRLYSIASSQKAHPDQVHLTVGRVSWQKEERIRKGVASTMLADRMADGDRLRIFVQPSHGFRVPKDPMAPMIMIGPGTGIAPFIAFLEEREACGANGKNWLFFGAQHQATDFLYQERLEAYQASGLLDRMDLAFSRDQPEKVYVQDRLLEHAAEVWDWLQSGAHLYVCGDAKRMAVDVDRALHEIARTQGKLSADQAKETMRNLADAKRYARDVY